MAVLGSNPSRLAWNILLGAGYLSLTLNPLFFKLLLPLPLFYAFPLNTMNKLESFTAGWLFGLWRDGEWLVIFFYLLRLPSFRVEREIFLSALFL